MDSKQIDQLISYFNSNLKQKRALIVARDSSDYDSLCALIGLKKLLEENFQTTVDIAFNNELSGKNLALLRRYNVEYTTKLEKPQYIINIKYTDDYGSKIDKVRYEYDEENFSLLITPLKGKFDFSRVSFKQMGASYETMIIIGCKNLSWLDPLYKQNMFLFENINIISIDNQEAENDYATIRVNSPQTSMSEIILEIAKKVNIDRQTSSDKIRAMIDVLMEGSLAYLQPMQVGKVSDSTIKAIYELTQVGGNIKQAFHDVYSYECENGLCLVKTLYDNIRFDLNAKVIWSFASKNEILSRVKSTDNLDMGGYIPFNISSKFNIAFELFELSENEIRGVLEVNDPNLNAKDLVGNFFASGNSSRVLLVAKDKTIAAVIESILSMIKSLTGIEVSTSKSNPSNQQEKNIPIKEYETTSGENNLSSDNSSDIINLTESQKQKSGQSSNNKGKDLKNLVIPPPID